MKDNLFNEVDKENLDIAKKILEDSNNLNVEGIVDEKILDSTEIFSMKSSSSKLKNIYKAATAVAACIVLVISANVLFDQNKIHDEYKDESSKVENSTEFSKVQDYSEIYERLSKVEDKNVYGTTVGTDSMVVYDYEAENGSSMKFNSSVAAPESTVTSSKSEEFYDTNEQTENVHEGDVVKTDGEYIYTLSDEGNYKVIITKVDETDMKIVSEIKLKKDEDDSYYFEELYVSGSKLVVVGSNRRVYARNILDEFFGEDAESVVNTIVQVYDINDRKKPELISENTQEGSYSNSRLSGDILYLISTHGMNKITPKECVPKVNDRLIPCDCIYLPEHIDERSFTVITTLDINDSKDYKETVAVAGGTTDLYASENNLYLISSHTKEENITDTKEGRKIIKNAERIDMELAKEEKEVNTYDKKYIEEAYPNVDISKVKKYEDYGVYTYTEAIEIVKYRYDKEKIEFVADVIVEGNVEDNLSFDEEKGYLRFVTTSSGYTQIETRDSLYDENGKLLYDEQNYGMHVSSIEDTNNIFVLDEKLSEKAHIEGLAKDERIYSARYYGDYGYFVTFKETDPLFSVDFSDIENPKIIGQLKIPGFSEYLHFYKDDKLFGLGMETENEGDSVYLDCLKMEMYDISDGSAATESKYVMEEFDYAEALYNYKAIMVDSAKDYIGFSASRYDYVNDEENQYYVLYTYKDDKFKELLRVKLDFGAYSARGFYIGDYLYIVSPSEGIKAVNLTNYDEDSSISELNF